jgi:hypothetical protein
MKKIKTVQEFFSIKTLSSKIELYQYDYLQKISETADLSVSKLLKNAIELLGEQYGVAPPNIYEDSDFKKDFSSRLLEYMNNMKKNSDIRDYYFYVIYTYQITYTEESLYERIFDMLRALYNDLSPAELRKLTSCIMAETDKFRIIVSDILQKEFVKATENIRNL